MYTGRYDGKHWQNCVHYHHLSRSTLDCVPNCQFVADRSLHIVSAANVSAFTLHFSL